MLGFKPKNRELILYDYVTSEFGRRILDWVYYILPKNVELQNAAIVVTSYLVRHPDGPILLDTGFALGLAKADALFAKRARWAGAPRPWTTCGNWPD